MNIDRLIWNEKARRDENNSLCLYARDRRGEAEEVGDDLKADIWGEVESWAEDQAKISESRLKYYRRIQRIQPEKAE